MLKALVVMMVASFGLLFVQEDQGPDLEGVKCVVNGERGANAEFAVEYGSGKVYFCCQGCVKKFKADQAANAPTMNTKANHQLVVTGQFAQIQCPISGRAVDAEQVVNVAGVEVSFCCDGCVTKIENAEGMQAKAEIVFGDKAFTRGYAKKAEEE